jgi:hypothetical protein
MKGYPVAVPNQVIDILKKGVLLRNKTAHAGKDIDEDTLKEILQAVRDLLYLLDFYAGQALALDEISHKTMEAIKALRQKQKGKK